MTLKTLYLKVIGNRLCLPHVSGLGLSPWDALHNLVETQVSNGRSDKNNKIISQETRQEKCNYWSRDFVFLVSCCFKNLVLHYTQNGISKCANPFLRELLSK